MQYIQGICSYRADLIEFEPLSNLQSSFFSDCPKSHFYRKYITNASWKNIEFTES